ncbi:MAG: family 43 glycosylhydrolase, partial [bacterium]|nr:family 43 glycosylhydrolase [bacterium]
RIEINPLVPEGEWDYFCLDGVLYHNRVITVLYDKTGERYKKGSGLRMYVDGKEIGVSQKPNPRIVAELESGIGGPLPGVSQDEQRAFEGAPKSADTSGGWVKSEHNPVLGGKLGTCFDVSVLKEGKTFRMWFSWRPKKSIALVESIDGVHWNDPVIVLGPNPATGWEDDINRPVVLKRSDVYHMWFTGQAKGHSWIGYATSTDGKTWTRMSDKPVLSPEAPWEKVAVMCPHVIWDEEDKLYRMWYSGGEQYEPDAIGYATSPDGRNWRKREANPVFRSNPDSLWEKHKVTACQVIRHGDWHVMFYIGFRDVDHAQIGLARSRDGITNWQRHPDNPIIRPGVNQWDHDAVYKPFAILNDDRWLLWCNGRCGGVEQIGLAVHEGENLGF